MNLAKLFQTPRMTRGGIGRVLRGQKGFTLIEVLVAVAILGVVAVAFLSALSTGYLSLILADKKTVAESLTRTEFEKIRQAPYPVAVEPYWSQPLGHLNYYVYVYSPLDDPEGDQLVERQTQRVIVEIWQAEDRTDPQNLILATETYKADPRRGEL